MMGLQRQEDAENTQKNKHRWYFYFDEKPDITQFESGQQKSNKMEVNGHKIPPKIRRVVSFGMSSKIAQDFLSWLTGSGGG